MSLARFDFTGVVFGFPRVSGDEPAPDESLDYQDAFSPRERG